MRVVSAYRITVENCKAIALIDPRGGIGRVAGVLRSGSTEKLVLCRPQNAHASDAEAVSYHLKCIDPLRRSRRVAGLRSPRQCRDGGAQPCILATLPKPLARRTLPEEPTSFRVGVAPG